MIVRFGYVANALALRDCSPSKTLTFTRWASMKQGERTEKLKEVTLENIQHTLRILHYNIAHEIPLYRFSSSLVPLATHPEVQFDYIHTFQHEWKQIGNLVKEHTLRVSFHPNQFTLFTSDKLHITENALTSMTYHYNLLQAMGLEKQTLINIHVGGAYGNKETATKRFFQNINMLPSSIKEQMTLENDDKTYTTEETVQICEKEHIPLVFDYHHHVANPSKTPLKELLPRIFATWTNKTDPPKIHLSSPKSEKEFRSHADYVDSSFIIPFLHLVKEIDQDIDVMIESKKKDLAFFQLMEDLSKIRGYKRIKGGFLSI